MPDETLSLQTTGVPVDGAFYDYSDLTGAEQLELRRVLREMTGHGEASLADFFLGGAADDFDAIAGITYVVRRRENPNYKLEQALERTTSDVAAEAKELRAKLEAEDPTTAGSSES
ncbi:MAG: hypothetical protein M3340_06000 [Actinomycetota bacterium]|nr:hypothetical protein [Actinomycetota bacterium]